MPTHQDLRVPDFLVIGAQKCATSWLYYCLKEHPELHLPAQKREVEYIGGDLYQERGPDWYYTLFDGANDDQVVGDVSVDYIVDARSPKLVKEQLPDVRLIASLRHPVDRSISAYYWYLRRNSLPDDLPLEEGLNRALVSVGNVSGGESSAFAEILERGRYDIQLKRYLDVFPPEQLAVVLYEDIAEKPKDVLEQIYGLLGVRTDFEPASLNVRPKENSYVQALIRLERVMPKSRVLSWTANKANQYVSSMGRKRSPPQLSVELERKLKAFFEPSILETQRILETLPDSNRPRDYHLSERWM